MYAKRPLCFSKSRVAAANSSYAFALPPRLMPRFAWGQVQFCLGTGILLGDRSNDGLVPGSVPDPRSWFHGADRSPNPHPLNPWGLSQPGQEAVKKTVRTFWCHNRGLSPTATKTDAAAAIYPYVFALLPRLMPPLRLGTGPMLVLLVLFGNSLFRPSQTAGEGS